MKKVYQIYLVVVVLLLAWAGIVICDTTFDWSAPGNSGTLTYTRLNLAGGTQAGVTNTGTTVAANITASGAVSAEDVASTDDGSIADDFVVGGMFRITPTALTATNGQVITVADGLYNVTAQGQATGYTNAITLANPTTAGDIVILHYLAASTNLLSFTDGGNLRLNGAYEMGDDDVLTLFAPSTSIWVEQSRSAN